MTTLVNMTPHAVTIFVSADETVTLATSGEVARVASATVAAGYAAGVPLARVTYGEVVGLPGPVDGTLYVVSAMVRLALPGRADLASPGELVRDKAGQPLGCRGLVVT